MPDKPARITIVLSVSDGTDDYTCYVLSDVGPAPVRGAAFQRGRWAAIMAARRSVTETRRQCRCLAPHLTQDECRRTKRAQKNEHRPDCLYWRALDEDTEVIVYPMTFGKARLCYGERGEWGCMESGWCYESPLRALEAARAWDGKGDPLDGWHRHVQSGRRREGGDPAKEYVYG